MYNLVKPACSDGPNFCVRCFVQVSTFRVDYPRMARSGRPVGEITGKYPNRLRELRTLRDLDLKDIAIALDVTPTQAGRLERGISQLSKNQCEILGELLGVDPWFFYGDGPDARTQTMLDIFRGLPRPEQDRMIKLGLALAEPATPFVAAAARKKHL